MGADIGFEIRLRLVIGENECVEGKPCRENMRERQNRFVFTLSLDVFDALGWTCLKALKIMGKASASRQISRVGPSRRSYERLTFPRVNSEPPPLVVRSPLES